MSDVRLLRLISLITGVLCLSNCAETPNQDPFKSALATWEPSPNFESRKPQLIIVHHTNMVSFEAALETLKTGNPNGRVSAHYLIGKDGRIAQLVRDNERAWHAGISRWRGQVDLNSSSIGIELDNDGYTPFPDAQIDALIRLLTDLTDRLAIEKQQVWAHADIAPSRKDDPNRYFPWRTLAAQGFGLWPRTDRAPVPMNFDPWQALARIGYDLSDRPAAVVAFHRHYFGDESAELRESDHAILADLVAQLDGF
jgi:N-acetylmuramoyl-L-alanine amidase